MYCNCFPNKRHDIRIGCEASRVECRVEMEGVPPVLFHCACGCGCKARYSQDSAYCGLCSRGCCGEDEPDYDDASEDDSDVDVCTACPFCGSVNCNESCCITCESHACPSLRGGCCPDWVWFDEEPEPVSGYW